MIDVKNKGCVRTLQMLQVRASEVYNHCTFVHGPLFSDIIKYKKRLKIINRTQKKMLEVLSKT